MEKAILLMNMPQHCGECICQHNHLCNATEQPGFILKEHKGYRPEWCPLRPFSDELTTRK